MFVGKCLTARIAESEKAKNSLGRNKRHAEPGTQMREAFEAYPFLLLSCIRDQKALLRSKDFH